MNEKVTVKDIISLALKGYSKDDIKELLELAQSKEGSTEEGEQKTPVEEQPKAKPEEEVNPSEDEAKEDAPNIDSLQKEIDDLKAQLKEAQANNNSSDLSGRTDNKTDEEIISDLARSFM
ncbi:MAG: hypothetical protein IKV80_07090 [Bacteroidales bacterium]|nr:hypothetical protein [Bacteroidales bacterium]